LCGEVIDLQQVSRRALSTVNLFVPGDYVADSLLLFLLDINNEYEFCHISLKFTKFAKCTLCEIVMGKNIKIFATYKCGVATRYAAFTGCYNASE
jgi:hypothetical protein